MTVASLLAELAGNGIRLRTSASGGLEVVAPPGRLSAELRERIADRRAELLSWLAGTAPDDGLPQVVPDPGSRHVPFPLSDLQQSFLMGSREGFEHHVRPHQYMEFDLEGIAPEDFEAALNAVLARHRHSLAVVGDDLLLHPVRDPGRVPVPVADLRGLPEAEQQARLAATRAAMERREPPLDRWPWLDARLSLRGGGRARLHYNNNNFFSDAAATMRFLGLVLARSRDPGHPLPELEVGYRDCVLALADLEETEQGRAARAYWTGRMADWPDAPALPLAAGADPRRRSVLRRRDFTVPAEVWAEARRRAAAHGITPTSLFYGVYAEVMAFWSGSRHFLVNNMITHRIPIHPQIGEVLGNFASLYPLEVDWRHDEPFHERARRLQRRILADMEHLHWSGVKVLQQLNQVRGTPGRAVCPYAVGSALFVGPQERPAYSTLETPQVSLDCEIWELDGGALWVVWDVIEEMFPDGLIDAMFAACERLLHLLASDPQAWQRRAFDLLPDAQRRRRIQINTAEEPPDAGLLHAGLAAPDGPDVVAGGQTIPYARLAAAARGTAAALVDAGVRPGGLVAVVLPKGPAQVTSVLGVLAANAVYVPVDPAWPDERIRMLLAETDAAAVLTEPAASARLGGLTAAPVLDATAPRDGRPPAPAREPDDAAYVIFTSGSTGRPKGAVLDHVGPATTIREINRRFAIGPRDAILGVSSLCFDLSVYDVFGALDSGATLVLPGAEANDPASWLRLVAEHGVTVWNSVPALMQLLAEEAAAAGVTLPSLRVVLLSGDWIPVDLPAKIRAIAPSARVVSLGGATEASIWSICFPIDRVDPSWPSIPYGRPLAGQTWHVLDELGRDAPDWTPGELYIGGLGVALGYHGDPRRTAASFVPHPVTGDRLYRTGDLGRYLPSGDLEFLGRADFQVKIQGFRVEPGEIEHALLALPGVAQAAVVARTAGSGRQLAAFACGDGLDPAGLRRALAGRLPSYLVPDHITVLDRLPLTGNGKLDRRALTAVTAAEERGRPAFVAPRTGVEKALAEVWESVLDVAPIGVDDDFFHLGGQSFAALRVTRIAAERLGRRVPVGALLERRTVGGLAGWLAEHRDAWSPLVRLADGAGTPWFLVHPAGGTVLGYRGLAGLLGVPAHGLQAPGPDAGGDPLDRVADFTGLYLAAVRSVQPTGPYVIGGWSSGAVLAHDLALALERQGETVRRLIVIDAPAPVAPGPLTDLDVLAWFLEDLGTGHVLGAAALARIAAAPPAERLRLALDAAGGRSAGLDAAELEATFAVFQGVVRACHGHVPGRIAADVTVIRAADGEVTEFAGHPAGDRPDWGWAELTRGAVRTARVPGTHHTLLDDRHAAAVAARLQEDG